SPQFYTLSLHDALPIFANGGACSRLRRVTRAPLGHQQKTFWRVDRPVLRVLFFSVLPDRLSGYCFHFVRNVLIASPKCRYFLLRSEEHTSELQSRENLV